MKISREELQNKLKRCLPGIDKTAGLLAGSDCFVFRNGVILAYNDYIGVTMPFPSDLACAIPAAPFYKALSSFKAKDVEVTQEGSKLTMKCGRAVVEFPIIEDRIYDRFLHILPPDSVWNELPTNFIATLKMGIVKNTTGMEGVFVHGRHLLSTNNVTIVDVDLDQTLERFWINNRVALELIKLPALESYSINASWIHFKSGDLMFSCRKLIDDNYPEEGLFKVLDAHNTADATSSGTLPDDLIEVLKRASIFCEENDEEETVVHCTLAKDLTISSSKYVGSFTETLDIEREGDDIVTWAMDVKQFISALQRSGKSVKFYVVKKDQGGAVLLVGDGWRQAIGLIKE